MPLSRECANDVALFQPELAICTLLIAFGILTFTETSVGARCFTPHFPHASDAFTTSSFLPSCLVALGDTQARTLQNSKPSFRALVPIPLSLSQPASIIPFRTLAELEQVSKEETPEVENLFYTQLQNRSIRDQSSTRGWITGTQSSS